MADATLFTIGAEARCRDGYCGEVIRVVMDPLTRTVTHLVVEPEHRQGLGRLVPLELVETERKDTAVNDAATKDSATGIRLSCTLAAFEQLEAAEATLFYPGGIDTAGYGPGQALAWPYFGSTMGLGLGTDSIPVGEVAVRRGQPVRATDGDIGRVRGLVINPHDGHVTHVLLEEGHLWGRKQVAIPISAVTDVKDGIRLTLTKHDVEDLPAVDVDAPAISGGP
jgi:sporulation protein YlmC with PRC-barrel domain